MINITTPKYLPYFQILLRTRKYYKLRGISNIVEGDEKKYYIFLKKRCVQIQIVNFEKEAIDENIWIVYLRMIILAYKKSI